MDQAAARRLLGVSPGATPGQVEAAFRVQVRSAHPDRGGDAERFQRVVEARRVLLAPRRSSVTPSAVRRPAQVQFAPSSSLLRQVAVIVARRLVERRHGPRPRRVI